jgi:hypothetical protein
MDLSSGLSKAAGTIDRVDASIFAHFGYRPPYESIVSHTASYATRAYTKRCSASPHELLDYEKWFSYDWRAYAESGNQATGV